ncbi:MAG: hypothetical protein PF692_00515 [Kiritimatiellae bacterium]|jgi:hypothetical protein|nr:hypothetical protein [Kiritimatiellia bacterium]
MNYILNNLRFFFSGKGVLFKGHLSCEESQIPGDFLGICVAGSPQTGYDEYLLKQLADLSISNVRLDYTYTDESGSSFNSELLKKLSSNGFKVMLHLVQPPEDAEKNSEESATKEWMEFVSSVLSKYHNLIECVEAGSTINRKKWTRYKSLGAFVQSWTVVYNEAKKYNLPVAGPNFTDFEPVYNVALLPELKRLNVLPDIHTNNMFAERAVQPELFDHKVLGEKLKGLHKFNLIKKAKLYKKISDEFGIAQTMSPHIAWSLRRIDRVLADKEEKQADYVARYCALLSASNSFNRMYWGSLVSQREGFIDDGTDFYPDLFHVALYSKANGELKNYRKRPAFDAYKTVQKFISGAKYIGAEANSKGLEIHKFCKDGKLLHMLWTTNGNVASMSSIYKIDAGFLPKAYDVYGKKLEEVPAYVFEKPVYLSFENDYSPQFLNSKLLAIRFKPFSYNEFSELIVNSDRKVIYKKKYMELVLKFINGDKTKYENTFYVVESKKALTCWNNLHELRRRGFETEEPVALIANPRSRKYSLIVLRPESFDKCSTADKITSIDALAERKCHCSDNGKEIYCFANGESFISCFGHYSFADR